MDERKAEAAIEAILFAAGESVSVSAIAAAIGLDALITERILLKMQDNYREASRGIELVRLEDSWQLCTKKECYDYLIRLLKQPRKPVLTDVMLETLSIVAYKQPVTRLEIETIRGVKSDRALNRLIEYNLIQEVGRLDAPGRPILFGTTEEFLRHFGLRSLSDLPEAEPVQVEDFKAEAEEEAGEKLSDEEK